MKFQSLSKILAAGTITLLSAFPAAAHAESSLLCASILPCDTNGRVVAPYDQGECAPIYAAQCQQHQIKRMGQEIAACNDYAGALLQHSLGLEKTIVKLKKQEKILRQKLKQRR